MGRPDVGIIIWGADMGRPNVGILIRGADIGRPDVGILIWGAEMGRPDIGIPKWRAELGRTSPIWRNHNVRNTIYCIANLTRYVGKFNILFEEELTR